MLSKPPANSILRGKTEGGDLLNGEPFCNVFLFEERAILVRRDQIKMSNINELEPRNPIFGFRLGWSAIIQNRHPWRFCFLRIAPQKGGVAPVLRAFGAAPPNGWR